jgi:hypothetical protein
MNKADKNNIKCDMPAKHGAQWRLSALNAVVKTMTLDFIEVPRIPRGAAIVAWMEPYGYTYPVTCEAA